MQKRTICAGYSSRYPAGRSGSHRRAVAEQEVQGVRDGQRRAIDSRGLDRNRAPGLRWRPSRWRPGCPGGSGSRGRTGRPARRVIAGVPEKAMAQFLFPPRRSPSSPRPWPSSTRPSQPWATTQARKRHRRQVVVHRGGPRPPARWPASRTRPRGTTEESRSWPQAAVGVLDEAIQVEHCRGGDLLRANLAGARPR